MRANYPGGNFRGSNCPVTQRNRQVWEKIKHKKILVKNICLGCCSEYKIIPWVMLFEWTNICNILNIIFEKRYLENPPGCNLKNNRVYELFRRSISSEMKNQNHFICKSSLLIAKRCCLVILWGLMNLAKTIWGVLVFYPKSNCSCWLLSWGQISWGKIIREALSWCSYMRCNYPGGNIPGDNYSVGKFRGSNCPVTQRNRQLWVKIKHKIIY